MGIKLGWLPVLESTEITTLPPFSASRFRKTCSSRKVQKVTEVRHLRSCWHWPASWNASEADSKMFTLSRPSGILSNKTCTICHCPARNDPGLSSRKRFKAEVRWVAFAQTPNPSCKKRDLRAIPLRATALPVAVTGRNGCVLSDPIRSHLTTLRDSGASTSRAVLPVYERDGFSFCTYCDLCQLEFVASLFELLRVLLEFLQGTGLNGWNS